MTKKKTKLASTKHHQEQRRPLTTGTTKTALTSTSSQKSKPAINKEKGGDGDIRDIFLALMLGKLHFDTPVGDPESGNEWGINDTNVLICSQSIMEGGREAASTGGQGTK